MDSSDSNDFDVIVNDAQSSFKKKTHPANNNKHLFLREMFSMMMDKKESEVATSVKEKMVQEGENVITRWNWKNPDDMNMNLLSCAATQNMPLVIKELLKCSYLDVNGKSEEGSTALHYACSVAKGNDAAIVLLKDKRVDVNCTDGYLQTPLWDAAHNANMKLVKIILAIRGEDVNPLLLNSSFIPWMITLQKQEDIETMNENYSVFSMDDKKHRSVQVDIKNLLQAFENQRQNIMLALSMELHL